jgi:hypothetical protein
MKHLVLGLFTIILLVGLIFFTGGFPQPKPLYAIGPHGEQAKVVDIDAYYEYQKNAGAVRATHTTTILSSRFFIHKKY